jgi:hypothetical protein
MIHRLLRFWMSKSSHPCLPYTCFSHFSGHYLSQECGIHPGLCSQLPPL